MIGMSCVYVVECPTEGGQSTRPSIHTQPPPEVSTRSGQLGHQVYTADHASSTDPTNPIVCWLVY